MVKREDLALSLSECLSGLTHYDIAYDKCQALLRGPRWVCAEGVCGPDVLGEQHGSHGRGLHSSTADLNPRPPRYRRPVFLS